MIIELEDLDVESLSKETLDLVSDLAAEIFKASGRGFSFNDPYLLPKLRRQVKRLNKPNINELYGRYKQELRQCVKKGHYLVRPYRLSASNRSRSSMANQHAVRQSA